MGMQSEERLDAIESRLNSIEARLGISSPKWSAPAAILKPSAANSPSPVSIEAKPGNWLGIIAAICFVLAAGFIIKLSIESGWLTPVRQVGLTAILGLTLIGTGLSLLKSDRAYASYLPAAGIVILYITVFGTHLYYSLISFEVALGLTGLVSAICVGLYWRIKHDIYCLAAAVGSYVAPTVLGFHTAAVFSVFYFAICSVAFVLISIWMSSRVLALVSCYFAFAMTAYAGFDLHQDSLIAFVMAVNFLIFSTGTYLYTQVNESPLLPLEAWGFLPALLAFYAAEYFYIDRIQAGLAPWVSLGFAAVLVGLYFAAKKYLPGRAQATRPVVLAYAAIVGFHSVYLELLPHDLQPWLFVVIMVLFAFASRKVTDKSGMESFYIPAFTLLAIAVIEYLSMVNHLLNGFDVSWIIVSSMAVVGMWLLYIVGNKGLLREYGGGPSLLIAAHVLAVITLYRLTTDQGSLAVSAGWLLYAVGVMVFAVTRKDETMAKSALAILGFSAAKVLLYDVESAPTIIRIFCLLLTGAVLYGCGLFMRKVTSWKNK